MKREGFWRYATPPVNIQGVPLPFTMIYLFICPFPSKTTFWICTGIILFSLFSTVQAGLSGRSVLAFTAF